MLLKDLPALVTGAAKGNGAAIAKGFASHGARVIVCDIDAEGAHRSAREIREQGGEAHAFALDVTDVAQCQQVVAQVRKEIGEIAVLVNNAGVRPRHTFNADDRDTHWCRAMDVNVEGVRNMSLSSLDSLVAAQGSIINITSIAASRASAQSIAYSTSKAAAEMLTKVMALELSRLGVRINAIAPGIIRTDMTESSRSDPARCQALMSRIPMGRFGEPDELVGPALFLASPLSSYVTGAVLAVDGGFLSH